VKKPTYLMFATLASCVPVAATAVPEPVERDQLPLSRYMRETLGMAFSFAQTEHRHTRRVHSAAIALQDGANGLIHWSDPPVASAEAREVFYAYAGDLMRRVSMLEAATRAYDADDTAYHLRNIRETCNTCHRYFRPAAVISPDVLLSGLDLGGEELGSRWRCSRSPARSRHRGRRRVRGSASSRRSVSS
jgi:cytochrome c556